MTNRVLTKLIPSAPESLHAQCRRASEQICMSYEYVKGFRPLASLNMSLPMIMAFNSATEERKPWIVEAMQVLGEGLPHARETWSKAGMEYIAKWFLGDPTLTLEYNVSCKIYILAPRVVPSDDVEPSDESANDNEWP